MRIATSVLVFVAFVSVSQVDAFLFGSLKDTISDLVKTINENVDAAVGTLENAISDAKIQSEQVIADAKNAVDNLLKQAVDNVLQSVEKQVSEAIKNAESNGVDVSECKSISNLNETATVIIQETMACATDVSDKAASAFTFTFENCLDALNLLKALKKKAEMCIEKVESIFDLMKAASCLASVEAESVIQMSTRVPSITSNIFSAARKMADLPPKLASCVSQTDIGAFTEQAENTVISVQTCIDEKNGKAVNKA